MSAFISSNVFAVASCTPGPAATLAFAFAFALLLAVDFGPAWCQKQIANL